MKKKKLEVKLVKSERVPGVPGIPTAEVLHLNIMGAPRFLVVLRGKTALSAARKEVIEKLGEIPLLKGCPIIHVPDDVRFELYEVSGGD